MLSCSKNRHRRRESERTVVAKETGKGEESERYQDGGASAWVGGFAV